MSCRHSEIKGEELSEVVKRIKKLRERDNETQEELAIAIGCTKAAISNIEQGKSNPSLETVKKIALHYKVSIDFICGLYDDMTIPSNVLDSLLRYISLEIRPIRFSQAHQIPVISINKGLFDYLNVLVRAKQLLNKGVPDDVINGWLEKEADKAKNFLRDEKGGTVEYALLTKRYIASDKVLSLLENVFDESVGDDGPL